MGGGVWGMGDLAGKSLVVTHYYVVWVEHSLAGDGGSLATLPPSFA